MDVHVAVLKLAESWQKALVADWQQQDLTRTDIRITVFNWLAVIICLYWAEEQRLLGSGRLESLRVSADAPEQLTLLWWEFCNRCGQKSLFQCFQLANSPPVKSRLIQAIIDSLYCSNLEQSKLTIHILGMLYEAHLNFFDASFDHSFESSEDEPVQSTNFGSLAQHKNKIKKATGIYYTPQSVVQSVVVQTIDSYFKGSFPRSSLIDYTIPQILDPSCGGGAFLLTAYQYLLDYSLNYYLKTHIHSTHPALQRNQYNQLQLSFNERQRLLSAIHGIDLDPQAVTITQVSLWLKLIETAPNFDCFDDASFIPIASIPITAISVHCGNALTAIDDQRNDFPALNFRWQAAFPNHIPNGFDIVLGNPPYIDAEQMTADLPAWRSYCTAHYQTATGNWDLFCIFIEKALQLCRLGGFTSLVVPNKLLSAHYATSARQLLSQTSRIISIRDYSQVSVFAASVYPIVYIAQKVSPQTKVAALATNPNTIYEQMQTLDEVRQTYEISLHHLTATAQPWLVGNRCTVKLMQRLDQLPKLGAVAQVLGAATVAEAYLLKDLIQENATPAATDFRLINSGTIDRYVMRWGQKPLRYLKQSYCYPVVSGASLNCFSAKRFTQAKQTKIIVAGMTQRLECAFDAMGSILAGKSTSIVLPSSQAGLDLRYLLALLNSRLASFYILNGFQGNRLQGGYLRIGSPQLRQIPIALPDHNQPDQQDWYQRILDLVDRRLKLHLERCTLSATDNPQQLQVIDQEIDALVYALYQLEDTEIETIVNDPQLLAIHR